MTEFLREKEYESEEVVTPLMLDGTHDIKGKKIKEKRQKIKTKRKKKRQRDIKRDNEKVKKTKIEKEKRKSTEKIKEYELR
jgi:hypothetical protein